MGNPTHGDRIAALEKRVTQAEAGIIKLVTKIEQMIPILERSTATIEHLSRSGAVTENQVGTLDRGLFNAADQIDDLEVKQAVHEQRLRNIESRNIDAGRRGWDLWMRILTFFLGLASALLLWLIQSL